MLLIVLVLSFNDYLQSQIITGKLIDDKNRPLSLVQLNLYTPSKVYTDITTSDGSFSFKLITALEDNTLPSDYSVSEFFPNPFNPKTRIAITLPNCENVKAEVFNTLGQKVKDIPENVYSAGINYLDLELNGLPNGVYISRISIGEKYTVTKKLMLIYGSQHLITEGNSVIPEITKPSNNELIINLDSLVATSGLIWNKSFTNLPVYTGVTLDLGNLIVERYCEGTPTVTYSGITYNTVQIGNQCWLRENLNIGIMIQGTSQQNNNGIIEKYCYNNHQPNCDAFGGIYLCGEALAYESTSGARGICPQNWHIPTHSEFIVLSSTVGGRSNALKEIEQGAGSGTGNNLSGFSSLLAGYRWSDGSFKTGGYSTYYWSSTEQFIAHYYTLYMFSDDSIIYLLGKGVDLYAFSVRCIKDN